VSEFLFTSAALNNITVDLFQAATTQTRTGQVNAILTAAATVGESNINLDGAHSNASDNALASAMKTKESQRNLGIAFAQMPTSGDSHTGIKMKLLILQQKLTSKRLPMKSHLLKMQ
jgi:folylpolyglutamate synthase/dihydropteroate synthase